MSKDNKIELQGKALQYLVQTKASSGLGEDNTGANLTQLEILRDILSATYLEGSLYDEAWKINVSEKAHGILLPIVDQSNRSTAGGILGGIVTYEIAEGEDITLSFPKFAQTSLPLNQIAVAARVTNALVQDATALPQFLRRGFEEAIRMKLDHSIIYGDGSTNIYGVAGSTAIGTRATLKMDGSIPYTVQNLKDMVSNYYGSPNGIWCMAHDAWHEIINLYSNSTNPILPLQFMEGEGNRTKAVLFGYEVHVLDCMSSRDIVLGDFTAFAIAQKELRNDFSEHLYFSSNETAFRSIIRINGCPMWSGPITEESGDKNYCYVTMQDDIFHSSSSSESSDSSSTLLAKSSSSSSSSSRDHSNSSNSSSSSSGPRSESSSSSSDVGECTTRYCAASFTNDVINGSFIFTGQIYNSQGVYLQEQSSSSDVDLYMWYHSVYGHWVISEVVGNPQPEWYTTKTALGGCPDGAWSLSGTLTEGMC